MHTAIELPADRGSVTAKRVREPGGVRGLGRVCARIGLGAVLALGLGGAGSAGAAEPSGAAFAPASVTAVPPPAALVPERASGRWSLQLGMAWITRSAIDEVVTGQSEMARGVSAGHIYLAQAALHRGDIAPRIGRARTELDVAFPLVLGVVDERGAPPFRQVSSGLLLGWRTFPGNRVLDLHFEMGVGLTYSGRVLAVQYDRHTGLPRSHLEFYWPIQFTASHPRHPRHRAVLFVHHHSGGRIFHKGGVNSIGVGYRLAPGG